MVSNHTSEKKDFNDILLDYLINTKATMLRVRVDKITLEKLDNSAKKLNTTRSEVIRKGIHKINGELQEK